MHLVKDEFIKAVIECLKDEDDLDIPYLIAPLVQEIDSKMLNDFFEDLSSIETFHVVYEPDTTGGYINGSINVYLTINQVGGARCDREILNYCYVIGFGIEERTGNFCDCSPNDEGYRIDKECCGYECEWDAPTITLQKVESLAKCTYNGNERNYWDFESGYYALDNDANKTKSQKEKENRITYLNNAIKQMQLELAELA